MWQSAALGVPVKYNLNDGDGIETDEVNERYEDSVGVSTDAEPPQAAMEQWSRGILASPDPHEQPRLCTGLPPLQSELAKWGQRVAIAEKWQSAALGGSVIFHFHEGAVSDLNEEDVLDDDFIEVAPPIHQRRCICPCGRNQRSYLRV